MEIVLKLVNPPKNKNPIFPILIFCLLIWQNQWTCTEIVLYSLFNWKDSFPGTAGNNFFYKKNRAMKNKYFIFP